MLYITSNNEDMVITMILDTCPKCKSKNVVKDGFTEKGHYQRYWCKDCDHIFVDNILGRVLYKPKIPNPQFPMYEKSDKY